MEYSQEDVTRYMALFGDIIAGEVYFEKRKPQNLNLGEAIDRENRARFTLESIRKYRAEVPRAIRAKLCFDLVGLERKCRTEIKK